MAKGKSKTTTAKRRFRSWLTQKRNRKAVVFWGVVAGILIWLFWGIPLPTKLVTDSFPVSTKIYDRNDKLIYEIYTDKRSTPLSLDQIPDNVKNATIAVEDKDFYKHSGVSFTGIGRAAYNTVFKRQLQGGSTLSQQLVKNALLSPERTVKRKVRELALTLLVETLYGKDKILELYLNQIPYGSTAYGIGAASELYFDKEAKDLTLAESALLAGLPASPTRYSPFGANPDFAKDRQGTVLRRMVEDGYITQEQADEAKAQEIVYAKPSKFEAPHFALWIKELLADKYGDAVVEQGGLRVKTTLDLDLQATAEKAVKEEVDKLTKLNVGNGAAIVTRPASGEILAFVGSKDYFAEDEDGKVNIILRERQPGSSFKPFNYALGIEDEKITAATPLADTPTCFSVVGQELYCPRNYDFTYHGLTQVRFALGNSYNIPAVDVLALNGIGNLVDFAKSFGFTTMQSADNYGLSLTLGGAEVRPLDMAQAYGVFANGGIKIPLTAILKVEDYKGKVLEETDPNEAEGDRVVSSETAFIISHILYDNNARSAAFGSVSQLNVSGHPEVSVKTGTTNDRRDNWTAGYTGQAVVITWVGNNDNSPMSGAVSGVSGASPIWNEIMKAVLDKTEEGAYNSADEGHAWPHQPSDVVGANICATIGILPTGPEGDPGCPTRFEYFKAGTVPTFIDFGHRDVLINKLTGQLAGPDDPADQVETQGKNVVVDPLGTVVCLDCPIASFSATIKYPLR